MSNRVVQRRAKIAPRRRLFFVAFTLLLSLGVVEILARLTVAPLLGPQYSFSYCMTDQKIIAQAGKGKNSAREVLHPYWGWTYDPDTDTGEQVDGKIIPVNEYGFVDDSSAVQTQEGTIVIAVLGGSFAQEFVLRSERKLIDRLRGDSRFHDQDIEVVSLALPGFKQPQSLMVMNYMLALGAEYDFVINLDGFNEAVLPITDNLNDGVDIAHPRGWHARLADVVDPAKTSISYRHHAIRAKRQMMAQNMLNSWLRWSYLRQVIWRIRDNTLQQMDQELARELIYYSGEGHRQFAISGPRRSFVDDADARQEAVSLWFRCSQQMEAVCATSGSKYLHCLQPNQYLPESKPLSEVELGTSYVKENHPFRQAVVEGYPMLREYGQRLSEAGVQFCDLTQIYKDDERTIYKDWCCHVNQTGYDLVAEAIAQEILQRW